MLVITRHVGSMYTYRCAKGMSSAVKCTVRETPKLEETTQDYKQMRMHLAAILVIAPRCALYIHIARYYNI